MYEIVIMNRYCLIKFFLLNLTVESDGSKLSHGKIDEIIQVDGKSSGELPNSKIVLELILIDFH